MSREAQASSQTDDEQRHPVRVTRAALLSVVPATFLTAASPAAKSSPMPTPAPTGTSGPLTGTTPKWMDTTGSIFTELFTHPLELACVLAVAGIAAVSLKLLWDQHTGDDHGFAHRRQMQKAYGARRLRSKKRRHELRPALRERKRREVKATDVGFYLGTCVHTHIDAYAAIGTPLAMVAPPGAGKSAKIMNHIIDAQGAVVATSTKMEELYEIIAQLRGGAEWFNPDGLAGVRSTIAWDPVRGCKDPVVAMRRAGFLLSGSDGTKGAENRDFWQGSNFVVLKSLLWAADVAGLTLVDVAGWTKNPADTTAIQIMKKHGQPPMNWDRDLEQVQAVPEDRTTKSIYQTLALTFSFLADPTIAQIVLDAHRTVPFDPQQFILNRGTLFMIGEDRPFAGIAPLFTCLTGEIYETAKLMGSMMPNKRIEPPLTFVLDEAALICSVPLERWTSDARGRGISVHAAFQTREQLYMRYGQYAGKIIWANSTKMILGGLGDDEAESISRSCGERYQTETSRTSNPNQQGMLNSGPSSVTKHRKLVPVMTMADVMQIPEGQILLMSKQVKPVMVKFTPVWERKDVKAVLAGQAKAVKLAAKKAKQDARAARKAARQPQPAAGPLTAPYYGAAAPNPWLTPAAPQQAPVAAPEPVWDAPVAAQAAYTDEWSDAPDYSPPAWYATDLPAPREESVYEGWPEGAEPVTIPQQQAAPVIPPMPQHAPTAHLQVDLAKPQESAPPEQAAEVVQDAAQATRRRRHQFSEWDEEVG